ncbi:MAG: hypothetical protein Q9P14_17360 [candidate division KSB1 bacterium]|nr:hypothetical protein [candidate division KSB1 bacterium]MDQ7064768.1 hypothetical protein [candidate division KSB1 bacterium]
MRILIFLLASVYFLTAWPVSIKTEYDSSMSVYPQIKMEARLFGEDGILLTWETKFEEDVLGFEIQRKTDGGMYETRAFVPAFADFEGHTYEYIDQLQAGELPIYRIKVVYQSQSEKELISPEFIPRHIRH